MNDFATNASPTARAARRRTILAGAVAGAAAALLGPAAAYAAPAALPLVEVWKNPSCGCCGDWISHLERDGFKVRVNAIADVSAVRTRMGIPQQLGSCHTASVGGYALEGHVPVREIRRLLKERPKAVGLAVPGMPIGSPGMDGPAYGGRKDPFDVLLVSRDGKSRPYQAYRNTAA